jgi:hypothetical protein
MNTHDPLLRLLHHLTDKVVTGEADSTDIEILAELFDQNPEYISMFEERRFLRWCVNIMMHS